MAQTTAKQMALRNGGDRRMGTFLFDVREYREDAVDDEQVRLTKPHAAAEFSLLAVCRVGLHMVVCIQSLCLLPSYTRYK